MLQVCFPMQGDSKPLTVICSVGPWVASSDKALCLINTLTAALSGQSHSSSLLKWLRKSLWPFGDWYSNFLPASQMICPEMKQSECDCLSLSLSFSLISSLFSPFSLTCFLPPHPPLSFSNPPSPTPSPSPLSKLSLKCNITCILHSPPHPMWSKNNSCGRKCWLLLLTPLMCKQRDILIAQDSLQTVTQETWAWLISSQQQ